MRVVSSGGWPAGGDGEVDGRGVGGELLAGRGDLVGRAVRDAAGGRAGLQVADRGLAVAADRDLGEELAEGDRLRAGLPVSPPSRVARNEPEGCQPAGGIDHDAPGVG